MKRFSNAIHRVAEREKRVIVQARDVGAPVNLCTFCVVLFADKPRCIAAHVVHKVDEFTFLEGASGISVVELIA